MVDLELRRACATRDTQSGFRVYPEAMFDVPLRSTKFDTETELLLRAAKMKLPLVEVPIKTIYAADHASHFHGFRDTLRVIKLVFFSPLWALAVVRGVVRARARAAADGGDAAGVGGVEDDARRAEGHHRGGRAEADDPRAASPCSGPIASGCARWGRPG